MNIVTISGRLTADPKISYGQGDSNAVARFTVAVERRFKREGQQNADFISCVAFGKQAEFAERYLHKGIKMLFVGHIQTGSFTNKDGNRVYTTDVVIESQEFCESKTAVQQQNEQPEAVPETSQTQTAEQYRPQPQEQLQPQRTADPRDPRDNRDPRDGFMRLEGTAFEEDLPFR